MMQRASILQNQNAKSIIKIVETGIVEILQEIQKGKVFFMTIDSRFDIR